MFILFDWGKNDTDSDTKAMGTNFAPMAANVYQRCMRIIDSVNVAYITQSMEVRICFYHHVEGGISSR